jgi:hypothetical protein
MYGPVILWEIGRNVWKHILRNIERRGYNLICGHLLTLVPRSQISYTLNTEAKRSSETSVNTISRRRHILEDVILHSHRRENLKSYIIFIF